MSTAVMDLCVAIADALLLAPAIAGGQVYVGQAVPLPEGQSEGVAVRPLRAVGQQPFAGDDRTDWSVDVGVSCIARSDVATTGFAALDTLLSDVYARLAQAAAVPGTDGWLVQPGLAYSFDEADSTIAQADIRLTVRLRTAAGTLAADT